MKPLSVSFSATSSVCSRIGYETVLGKREHRLLCLVMVFNSPKQSSARPERLSSRSKIDLQTKNGVLLNVRGPRGTVGGPRGTHIISVRGVRGAYFLEISWKFAIDLTEMVSRNL